MNTKNPYIEKILSAKSSVGKYDCAVMFSGGKDSSYLLYLFKKVYKKNVIAITIDNGFESDLALESARKIAQVLDVPHVVIDIEKENFKNFYQSTTKEYTKFWKEKFNHICVICNNLLLACALKYASENNIPYVISGLEKSQLNSGRQNDLEVNEFSNAIAEKTCKFILRNGQGILKTTENYANKEGFRKFVDVVFSTPSNVTTIFPFIYLDYDIEKIKQFLTDEIGWKPPTTKRKVDYIASGCELTRVLPQIEKLGIIEIMEREHLKRLVLKDNALSSRYLENVDDRDESGIVNLKDDIFDTLEIKDFIIEKCKEKNMGYSL